MAVDVKARAGLEAWSPASRRSATSTAARACSRITAATSTTSPDAERGVSFEEVCHLLWHGRLPTRADDRQY